MAWEAWLPDLRHGGGGAALVVAVAHVDGGDGVLTDVQIVQEGVCRVTLQAGRVGNRPGRSCSGSAGGNEWRLRLGIHLVACTLRE